MCQDNVTRRCFHLISRGTLFFTLWFCSSSSVRKSKPFCTLSLKPFWTPADFLCALRGSGLLALSNKIMRPHIWHPTWQLIRALKSLCVFLFIDTPKFVLLHSDIKPDQSVLFGGWTPTDSVVFAVETGSCIITSEILRVVTRDSLEDGAEGRLSCH